MASDNILVLPDSTIDFTDFKQQFEAYYSNGTTWQGTLTTQTSTTLIDMASTIGTFLVGRVIRAQEDAFPETAQSNDAILANAQAQGLRLTRYLPAQSQCTLNTPFDVSLSPLTQFSIGGYYFFNREQLNLNSGDNTVTLYEGRVQTYLINGGDGSDLQTFIAPEDSFQVSDQDVQITINQVLLPKALGGLWNYRGLPAYSDLTLADGRFVAQFGTSQFGTVPQVNDILTIKYPVTMGASGNNLNILNQPVTVATFPAITGVVTSAPQGGANDKPISLYKSVASGSLGTYSSAVTKPQYNSIIATYPGIVDAYTQAQREINPRALEWMNVIRVSALTTDDDRVNPDGTRGWTQAQRVAFTDYCQTVTMYAVYFLYQEAIPVGRDVDVSVYVFNSADTEKVLANSQTAIQNLFAPRPGILMTNFYTYDIEQAIKAASPGLVSYVIVNKPTGPMIVTAPPSPQITYTLIPGGGTLDEGVYAYSISTTAQAPDGTIDVGTPQNWVFPQITTPNGAYAINLTWPAVPNAIEYKVWGRVGSSAGLLATISASSPLTFTDDGSITPSGPPPNTIADVPIRYNKLQSLNVTVRFAERQQTVIDADPTRLINE